MAIWHKTPSIDTFYCILQSLKEYVCNHVQLWTGARTPPLAFKYTQPSWMYLSIHFSHPPLDLLNVWAIVCGRSCLVRHSPRKQMSVQWNYLVLFLHVCQLSVYSNLSRCHFNHQPIDQQLQQQCLHFAADHFCGSNRNKEFKERVYLFSPLNIPIALANVLWIHRYTVSLTTIHAQQAIKL